MIDQKYINILDGMLIDDPVYFQYDSKSRNKYFAEIIYFFLLFGIGLGIIYRKVFLVGPESSQVVWDFVLAILFLTWSLFVLLRAIFLKPVPGSGIMIDRYGLSCVHNRSALIPWSELKQVYNLPWLLVFKGGDNRSLSIGFFQNDFLQVAKLFNLLMSLPPKSKVKAFNKELEIKNIIESMKSNVP